MQEILSKAMILRLVVGFTLGSSVHGAVDLFDENAMQERAQAISRERSMHLGFVRADEPHLFSAGVWAFEVLGRVERKFPAWVWDDDLVCEDWHEICGEFRLGCREEARDQLDKSELLHVLHGAHKRLLAAIDMPVLVENAIIFAMVCILDKELRKIVIQAA